MCKKSFIRVGVRASDGAVSGTWKIWTKNNEIYILERLVGSFFKASLHKSGNWQISFNSEFIADKNVPNQKRHMMKWEPPIDNIGRGMTLAFRIVIPESELRKPTKNTTQKKINWINAPKKGFLTEINLILTNPATTVSNWPGKKSMQTSLLKEIKLPNEDTLWIIYYHHPIPENLNGKIVKFRTDFQEKFKKLNTVKPKAIIMGDENDGSRTFLELSLS